MPCLLLPVLQETCASQPGQIPGLSGTLPNCKLHGTTALSFSGCGAQKPHAQSQILPPGSRFTPYGPGQLCGCPQPGGRRLEAPEQLLPAGKLPGLLRCGAARSLLFWAWQAHLQPAGVGTGPLRISKQPCATSEDAERWLRYHDMNWAACSQPIATSRQGRICC